MDKLNEYLEGRKARDLAKAAGISESMLSQLRKGKRKPRLGMMRKIYEATNGEVTYDDWGASALDA